MCGWEVKDDDNNDDDDEMNEKGTPSPFSIYHLAYGHERTLSSRQDKKRTTNL